MRKKKYALFLVSFSLIALFVLVTCSPNEEDSTMESSGSDSSSELEGVSMQTEQDSYPVGTEVITVFLTNDSDEEYYYGKEFRIEQQTDNGWQEVLFEEEMAWIQIAIELTPGEQTEEPIDLTFFEEDLDPGQYRVVKQIDGVPVYAEFRIE